MSITTGELGFVMSSKVETSREMTSGISTFQRILIAILAVTCVQFASADSPGVTAVLSKSQAVVGEDVQLEIRLTGARGADAPEQIPVDGLEIHRTGTSQRVEINNFNLTASVSYDYTVLPLKEGTFTIPPQTIHVGSSALRTPTLTLHVAASSNQPARQYRRGTQPTTDVGKLVFAELIVPKKSAFVGEMVPVQVRLAYDPRTHPQLIEPPEITGQGFTAQKLQESGENLETINGKTYNIVTFKSAIAAAHSGNLEIGPVKAKAQMVVPRRPSVPRSRSPFDLFDLDDPFSDPFFSNPFSQFGERREVAISSEPVALEIKPLPQNAPLSFSGAIGNFTMTTDAKPKSVQVGDPITVTSTISGRGNFDRVNAPVIEDEHGWHKYPPSSKFKQDDEVGISGEKTFETVLSPNERKQILPVLAFSYFDPVKEQYVTTHSEPIAITVQGSAAATQNAAASRPTSLGPTPVAPRPSVTTRPADILYQLTERPAAAESFAALYTRPVFWIAQLAPFVAIIGFAGWKIRKAKVDNREARRIAALQHELAERMRKLHRIEASPREYYAEASRAVRVKAALASGKRQIDPNAVDAEAAANTFGLNGDSRERLRRLFEQSDELQYSGADNGSGRISSEDRRDILKLVENL
jgi:oxygen tolerance protein BatD